MLNENILIERAGNFTASENHKLMAGWNNPNNDIDLSSLAGLYEELIKINNQGQKKPLVSELKTKATGKQISDMWSYINSQKPPAGLVTYAKEKAIETIFDYDESLNFSTVHTRNGEEREEDAVMILAEKTGLNFENTGENQIHIHDNEVGCTPDGVVKDELDLVITGCEIKCKSPLSHAELLLLNNGEDLKNNFFDHYIQVQTQMLVTGTDHWFFAFYNPFAKEDEHKFKYFIVYYDSDVVEILKKRIELAKKIKKDFLINFEKSQTKKTAERKTK